MSQRGYSTEQLLFPPGPWRHRSISANGSQFHCVESGDGPLVVFLHGFPDYWWTWRHQLDAIASSGFRAVAMDLRGYGASDKPPRGYDGYTLANDVIGVVRALGEARAVLVGHDWGAFLAQVAAVLYPHEVAGVGIVGSAHPLRLRREIATHRPQLTALRHVIACQMPRFEHYITRQNAAYAARLMERWAGETWRQTEDFATHVSRCRQAISLRQSAFCAVEYHRWAIRSLTRRNGWRLASLLQTPMEAPILHIHGGSDPCILPSTARGGSLYAASGLRYIELPQVGHYPQCEEPSIVIAALLEWLKKVNP